MQVRDLAPAELVEQAIRKRERRSSCCKMPSALSDHSAWSASLDRLKARAAATHPEAAPERLESSHWPQYAVARVRPSQS